MNKKGHFIGIVNQLVDKKIIGVIVGAVIIAGVSFYGGMAYANQARANLRANFPNGQFNANGAGGMMRGLRGGGMGGGFIGGQIIAKDDKSVTVQLPNNGGSKIIFFSGSTQVMKSVSGASSDLAVGQEITANGSSNSDGSINAQSIQIRPARPAQNQ